MGDRELLQEALMCLMDADEQMLEDGSQLDYLPIIHALNERLKQGDPPKPTLADLTDDELRDVYTTGYASMWHFARAALNKIKEKNS